MKKSEFKNVRNGFIAEYEGKIWLEPHDPSHEVQNFFSKLFSELKQNCGSRATGSNFTLAAVESDEEFNDKSFEDHANHPDLAAYKVKFRFVLIFEGDGVMDMKDVFIPDIRIPEVEFCDCGWLNDYWMSQDLPAELLVLRSFLRGRKSSFDDLPENFGKFSSDVTMDANGKLLDDSSFEWKWLADNAYNDDESTASGYSLDSDVCLCSANLRNGYYGHYLRVPGIIFQVGRLESWELHNITAIDRFESVVAAAYIERIIRTDREFDLLPFGEKEKRVNRALLAYGSLQNYLDEHW